MTELEDRPTLTTRFDEALALASDLHRQQVRKSTSVPYISHLMGVAALVLEDGGDEDEAIAAPLHDALEDCADRITAEDIEARFGPRVREIVEDCTDTPSDFEGGRKPPWMKRKKESRPIHLTVSTIGQRTEVSFKDREGELAVMTGPRTVDALAWIMAAVTDPFTTVLTTEQS